MSLPLPPTFFGVASLKHKTMRDDKATTYRANRQWYPAFQDTSVRVVEVGEQTDVCKRVELATEDEERAQYSIHGVYYYSDDGCSLSVHDYMTQVDNYVLVLATTLDDVKLETVKEGTSENFKGRFCKVYMNFEDFNVIMSIAYDDKDSEEVERVVLDMDMTQLASRKETTSKNATMLSPPSPTGTELVAGQVTLPTDVHRSVHEVYKSIQSLPNDASWERKVLELQENVNFPGGGPPVKPSLFVRAAIDKHWEGGDIEDSKDKGNAMKVFEEDTDDSVTEKFFAKIFDDNKRMGHWKGYGSVRAVMDHVRSGKKLDDGMDFVREFLRFLSREI